MDAGDRGSASEQMLLAPFEGFGFWVKFVVSGEEKRFSVEGEEVGKGEDRKG